MICPYGFQVVRIGYMDFHTVWMAGRSEDEKVPEVLESVNLLF